MIASERAGDVVIAAGRDQSPHTGTLSRVGSEAPGVAGSVDAPLEDKEQRCPRPRAFINIGHVDRLLFRRWAIQGKTAVRTAQIRFLICGLLLPGMAAACPNDTLALRCLDAIETMQWERMRSLLAEDTSYTDPTMIYFGRAAIDIRRAETIVAFWQSSSEDSRTTRIDYETTACFETAGYYMVNLDSSITVAGKFWNVNRPEITLPGKVLSIIRVVEGLVTAHQDYVEYANADRVVTELQARYGKAEPEVGEAR